VELDNVKAGGTYNYHCALKGYATHSEDNIDFVSAVVLV
jgi:hypothetical protein